MFENDFDEEYTLCEGKEELGRNTSDLEFLIFDLSYSMVSMP